MQLLQKSDGAVLHTSLLRKHALVFYGLTGGFELEDCLPLLSEKEMARSERYLLDADKNRYRICRAILKRLLSKMLQADEHQPEIEYTKHGKPFLPKNPELQFSMSHTGDVFVIALAIGGDIGVDVECLNREVNFQKLQAYVFTPAELNRFRCMDDKRQREFFMTCWTKKEALLKATGEGLTASMNTLELSLINPDAFFSGKEPERHVNETGWLLDSFAPLETYMASVAVRGSLKKPEYMLLNASHRVLK